MDTQARRLGGGRRLRGGGSLAATAGTNGRSGSRPIAVLGLAVAGCAISAYLAAFEMGWLATVWDPLFGDGSRRVLTSAVSRAFPVPDGLLGALGYAVDALLAALLALGLPPPDLERRVVLPALALASAAGAIVGLGLAVLQPITAGTFCTLCLCSSAISVALAALVAIELRTLRHPPTKEARS